MAENSNKRLLFLPPGVQKGKERELRCEDFICFDSKSLGQGAFGEVFKVRHKISGRDFAIKVIQKRKIIERRMLGQLRREIRIMYCLKHPNIVALHSHFEDANNFYLIMELATGGCLFDKLKRFKTLNEEFAAQYMREIFLAVQYLQSRIPPIIHRDIKPENILIDSEDVAKLGDFGWSNFFDEERATYCGTMEYLAPEMISRKGHGVSLDIWSLGILLYELLTGSTPFRARTPEEIFSKIKEGKVRFPKSFPILAKDLVKRMLQIDPEKRLSIEMVLEHSWLLSHTPLRPTAELVTTKVELPSVPDEGDVDFTESGYCIVSAPKGNIISPKINVYNNGNQLELALKIEECKLLQLKVDKAKSFLVEANGRIKLLQHDVDEIKLVDCKIEGILKKTHELKHKNNLIYKRFMSKLSDLKVCKKRLWIIQRKVFKVQAENKVQSAKMALLKTTKLHLNKINCFEGLKNRIEELSYSVFLLGKSLKMPEYLPIAEKQIRQLKISSDSTSEIEKFIPEFKRMFTHKSKSLKTLTSRLKDLKSTTLLQSQIIKTIKLKS